MTTFSEDKGMSTPTAPKPPASGTEPASHPTRQLLDELDALMQRMLALPMNQLEEELRTMAEDTSAPPTGDRLAGSEEEASHPAPPADSGEAPRSWPASADVPGAARADEAGEVAPPHAPLIAFQPLPATDQATPPTFPQESEPPQEKPDSDWERLLPAGPEVLAALGRPPVADQQSNTPEGVIAAEAPSSSLDAQPGNLHQRHWSLWLRPVLWSNWVFDGVTRWLGPPGRWLRSPAGRALLGWVGLGLLAGAAAWLVAFGFGWT
jgi:hypothetical protein